VRNAVVKPRDLKSYDQLADAGKEVADDAASLIALWRRK
jgi:hypothetical protein